MRQWLTRVGIGTTELSCGDSAPLAAEVAGTPAEDKGMTGAVIRSSRAVWCYGGVKEVPKGRKREGSGVQQRGLVVLHPMGRRLTSSMFALTALRRRKRETRPGGNAR